MTEFARSLFIFRRDLRLDDNRGLLYALEHSQTVIPCFIFTPQQFDRNPYRSDSCVKFMLESLAALDSELRERGSKLYLFHGKTDEVIANLVVQMKLDAVVVNTDYTPFSKARDEKIEKVCKKEEISFLFFHDALLHPPGAVLKPDGKPYLVFTPFYKASVKHEVEKPIRNRHHNFFKGSIRSSVSMPPLPSSQNAFPGGRTECLKILKKLARFSDYTVTREIPSLPGTTHLSAYLKFTTCSVREIYAAIAKTVKPSEPLLRQLYWRDFFTCIAFHFPHVFGESFHPVFDKIHWKSDSSLFRYWCQGETGFPIVDAGMREMNASGYMHNRVRMIAGSFLVKDLHIDWRLGEKYFAQRLIDYDPAVNNGNWQWVAGTGADAAPYFRIFNPWTQQMKFDPDCVYIKKWIPELSSYDPKEIHNWKGDRRYPAPRIDHKKASKETLSLYSRVKK